MVIIPLWDTRLAVEETLRCAGKGAKAIAFSENLHAFTLRGFHYLATPHAESKTISCLRGRIYDVVVDLRPDSATYMKWLSFELNDELNVVLHDRSVVERLSTAFETDLGRARRVTYEAWQARGLRTKLLELFVMPIESQL